jgi:hypothetical protein
MANKDKTISDYLNEEKEIVMIGNLNNDEYGVYTAVAGHALFEELPHIRIRNGIVIQHVPKDTYNASALLSSIKNSIHRKGYKMNTRWLDEWTLRVTWSK